MKVLVAESNRAQCGAQQLKHQSEIWWAHNVNQKECNTPVFAMLQEKLLMRFEQYHIFIFNQFFNLKMHSGYLLCCGHVSPQPKAPGLKVWLQFVTLSS